MKRGSAAGGRPRVLLTAGVLQIAVHHIARHGQAGRRADRIVGVGPNISSARSSTYACQRGRRREHDRQRQRRRREALSALE